MTQYQKDIKKKQRRLEDSKSEITPILYKNGKYLIPTSRGYVEVKKRVKH